MTATTGTVNRPGFDGDIEDPEGCRPWLLAYTRGLAEYMEVCEREGVDPVTAGRAHIGLFVRALTERPSRRGANVVALSTDGPSDAAVPGHTVHGSEHDLDNLYGAGTFHGASLLRRP
ncbi:hypothetical protein [Nonomuraea cavernae]|uniref:Uncharacterized protein n=1 Tax=Nonomuraea cavernae TaxID=2045107 RepID=A0A917Z9F3_9ACTN|nr:hypothetical protein [Nonomuraea cavernae]MCA2187200.1 hypothetical protein [Nonomuraea cavernae]GGO78955.1 hypothetical protein GCM10012289_62140 [Nonomuraea cavernae]